MCGGTEIVIKDHIYHEVLLHISQHPTKVCPGDPGRANERLRSASTNDLYKKSALHGLELSSSLAMPLRWSLETEDGKLSKCCIGVSLPSVLEALSEIWSVSQPAGVSQLQLPPVPTGKVQSDQSLVVECTL